MWAREPDALLMLTPLDGENYTLEMHLRNFPQRQPVAVYWNDGVWEVNANIDAEESIRERDSARFSKRHCKATANDLRRILQSRNETVVDKNNRLKIASILGVSERTVYTLWRQLKDCSGGFCSE